MSLLSLDRSCHSATGTARVDEMESQKDESMELEITNVRMIHGITFIFLYVT
jgi:hypothetical protein